MWQYNYTNDIADDELYHYGVLGMKWGVRKSISKEAANSRYERQAVKYDKKSAALSKKSEQLHVKQDLGYSNRSAIKAEAYKKKAAKKELKALKTTDERKRVKYETQAANLKYKAAKNSIKGNMLAKQARYGYDARKAGMKADKYAAKAANMRRKIANNKSYIAMVNRKVSSLTGADSEKAKAYIEYANNNSIMQEVMDTINKKGNQ